MNPEKIDYTSYAELLISSGINLQKGQNIIIRFYADGIDLARKCAETAYRKGAGIVDLMLMDPIITKSRIDAQSGREDLLSLNPGWKSTWEKTVIDENWAFLALESFEYPGTLADCDQQSVMLFRKHQAEAIKDFRNAINAHSISWCVAGAPGPRWAEDVLGKEKTTEDLWDILKPILLLDTENPGEAWKRKAADLIARSKKLDLLELDALHFEDGETDLVIGLTTRAHWQGGPEDTKGVRTMPNLPTEEVFTTPDRKRCDGTVLVTRPVDVRGTIVKGARMVFKNGILTDLSAEEGEQALKAFVNTDSGARYLGEVALVAEDSPIAASGLIFGSILYDENASCHIALGSGYPSCLSNAEELIDEESKLAAACNVSIVHLDFMIGSPTISVTGTGRDGRKIPIIQEGKFVALV